jgi:Trp operon repressor
MTHVSKRRLDVKIYTDLEKAFDQLLSNLEPDEVKHITSTLLTNTEKLMLIKRLGILSLIEDNLDQDTVAKVLKTTRQTVSRIELQLFKVPETSKDFVIKKLNKWQNFQNFKKALVEIATWSAKKLLRASIGKT